MTEKRLERRWLGLAGKGGLLPVSGFPKGVTADDDRCRQGGQPHLPVLDGLRGFAILLVVAFHALPGSTAWWERLRALGWCGVDLFFVLSGFLITGILCDSKGGAHYFRNFYVRRGLRIFPLYYGTLCLLLLLLATGPFPAEAYARLWSAQGWLWLYLSNVWVLLHHEWLPCGTNHFWSLAVEEQFYLFWPLLVFLCNRRALFWVCVFLFLGAWAGRAWVLFHGYDVRVGYLLTLCRADAFAAGGLVSLAVRRQGAANRIVGWSKVTALGCALLLLGFGSIRPHFMEWQEPLTQAVGYTLVAVLFGSLLAWCVTGSPRGVLQRVFNSSVLKWLGRYSYGIYVFHFPLLALYGPLLPPEAFPLAWQPFVCRHVHLVRVALVVSVTLLLAFLSWHLYEQPFLRLKDYFPRGKGLDESPGVNLSC